MSEPHEWDYKLVQYHMEDHLLPAPSLRDESKQGWELVSAEYEKEEERWYCVFKRPAQGPY